MGWLAAVYLVITVRLIFKEGSCMDVLTSHSSPLIIASVQGVACNGTVGMTLPWQAAVTQRALGSLPARPSLDLDRVQSWALQLL